MLNERLIELNANKILEARPEEKLRLENLIDYVKTQRDQVGEQLKDMESQSAKVDSDAKEVAGRNDDHGQKWQTSKTVEESNPAGSGSTPPARETKRGKIFISYASEDRTVMETFASALEKAGLDIWWDKSIETVRHWDEVIEQQIEEACVFVALLSQHTIDPVVSTVAPLRPPDRVFRQEWKAAFERNKNFFGLDLAFIIPVYIDDVEWNSPGIKKFMEEKLQGIKAPNGNPPASLLERLRTLQRNYRRSSPR